MVPSSPIGVDVEERVEILIVVVPDLALRRRTCYEPVDSTHPDKQGGGGGSWFHHRRSELMLGRGSRYSSWLFLISRCEGGVAMNRGAQLTLTRRDGRGCCLPPFVSRAGWHTADAGDDRLGSPADKTGSAASFHCSHSLCRAFSPVTAVVSGIAVVRRSNEADAHGLEASCRHGRVGAPLETDAVAQSRRAGRARRHLTINPAEDRTRRSRGVD